jgi:hypothetical protein
MNMLPQESMPMAKAMEEYVQAQKAQLEKEHKKGVLSFDLAARRKEVGLANLTEKAIPSEESLIKLEEKSKSAREKGRLWVGSAEGEDLQISFPPRWAKAPVLNTLPPGEGSFEDKMKTVWDANRARSMAERIDFRSFANFQAHVMSWGYKMILTKVFSPVDLLSYMHVLVNVADDRGGVKTAYQYDLICRQEMAEALEQKENDLRPFLTKLDNDRLKEATMKTDQKLQEMGRTTARAGDMARKGPVSYWPGAKKPYHVESGISTKGQKGGGKGSYNTGHNYGNSRQANQNGVNRARDRSRSPRRQHNQSNKQQQTNFTRRQQRGDGQQY